MLKISMKFLFTKLKFYLNWCDFVPRNFTTLFLNFTTYFSLKFRSLAAIRFKLHIAILIYIIAIFAQNKSSFEDILKQNFKGFSVDYRICSCIVFDSASCYPDSFCSELCQRKSGNVFRRKNQYRNLYQANRNWAS